MRSAEEWLEDMGTEAANEINGAGGDASAFIAAIQADALDEAIAVCNRLSYQFYGAQKCEEALRALIRHPADQECQAVSTQSTARVVIDLAIARADPKGPQ